MPGRKKREPLSPEAKRKRLKRRIAFYAGFAALLGGFYKWQPIRVDLIARKPPVPNPPVDPDSARLFSKGVKIALIQAHPDDSEFYLAPLLLKLKASGAEIHQLVMTDGDKSYYFWQDNSKLRGIRQQEQREASSHYAQEIQFLGRPDGRLGYQEGNADAVRQFLEKVQPEYVLAFDNVYWQRRSHDDHRQAGIAAWQAAQGVRSVRWMLLYSTEAPNFVPNVDKTVDAGIQLLATHKSQFSGKKLDFISGMLMSGWYEAAENAGGGYGVPLRAVRLGSR